MRADEADGHVWNKVECGGEALGVVAPCPDARTMAECNAARTGTVILAKDLDMRAVICELFHGWEVVLFEKCAYGALWDLCELLT